MVQPFAPDDRAFSRHPVQRSRWWTPLGWNWRVVRDYLVAVAGVLFSLVMRLWLDPMPGDTSQFTVFIFATIFAAWYGGLGPAIVAMSLGLWVAIYFLRPPYGQFVVYDVHQQMGALLFLGVGVASMIFSESLHAAQRSANALAAELEIEKQCLQREIQERKQAQEAYAGLLSQFFERKEEERRRIARELHDQIGQDFVALRLGLQSLSSSLRGQPSSAMELDKLYRLFDQIGTDWHHLTLELRPPALDELGLVATVRSYLTTWSQRTKIRADFEFHGCDEGQPSHETDIAFYRVIQESLTNVAKHAGTQFVSIVIERRADALVAIIEDHGKGFNVEQQTSENMHQRRLGLLGMRERLSAIGGTLEIESAPGSGTTIYARAPLKRVKD